MRLRTLELDSQVGGAGTATFNAHLAGLPPSLQRLSLQVCSNAESNTDVFTRPQPLPHLNTLRCSLIRISRCDANSDAVSKLLLGTA
jgi:hypothetical protein